MSNGHEEFLIEQIKKSGYPLEIEISSFLDDNNWTVFNNNYYIDKNTNKAREIDILALQGQDINKIYAQIVLVLECKKSNTHTWIFFSRPKGSENFLLSQYHDFVQAKSDNETSLQNEIMTYIQPLHYEDIPIIASTYAEIKYQNKQSKKDEIFEATNQLTNYILYSKENSITNTENRLKFIRSKLIRFYFLIIVFDGKLYDCTIKSGEPELQATNHILLHYWLPEGLFYIDVVKKEYFEEFINKKINAGKDQIFEGINENQSQIIEIAESRTRKDDVAMFGPKK